MALAHKIYLWLVFGMLVSPEDLEYQGAMNLVKYVMSEGPNTALVRDESAFLYMNYEYMFDNYKSKTIKLGKLKPIFKYVVCSCNVTSLLTPISEKELQLALLRLRCITGNDESSIAKKSKIFITCLAIHQALSVQSSRYVRLVYFVNSEVDRMAQILVAALTGAKEEILWFVRHKDKIPGKRGKPEDFQDPRIIELIHYVVKFQLLLRDNIDSKSFHSFHTTLLTQTIVVKRYYLEFLSRTDLSRLREFQQEAAFQQHGPELVGFVTELISLLSKITPETDSGRNFEALRLLWCQAEVGLSPLAMKSIKLIEKINFIMQHTEYIDSTEQVISKACSLRELYYFKSDFMQVSVQNFVLVCNGS